MYSPPLKEPNPDGAKQEGEPALAREVHLDVADVLDRVHELSPEILGYLVVWSEQSLEVAHVFDDDYICGRLCVQSCSKLPSSSYINVFIPRHGGCLRVYKSTSPVPGIGNKGCCHHLNTAFELNIPVIQRYSFVSPSMVTGRREQAPHHNSASQCSWYFA